jgi:hypothetical protein
MCRWVLKGPERDVWVYLIICIVAGCERNTQRRDQSRLESHLDIPGLFLDRV